MISRKVAEESEMEEVKETEKEELREEIKEVRESRPWGQRRKISSIYRAHRRGLRTCEFKNVVSKWPI